MLKIFNDLRPFFEDNYRRIHVRGYARLRKISPPSASKLLESLRKDGLLQKEKEHMYIYYAANREDELFINLCRLYWMRRFAGLLDLFEKELIHPVVVLFGSFAKAEIKKDSDIDIAIFSPSKKELSLARFERRLNRRIQLFTFRKRDDVPNKELLENILNGFILRGRW